MIEVVTSPQTRPITLVEVAAFVGLPENSESPLLRMIYDGVIADVERNLGVGIGVSHVRVWTRRLVNGRIALPYSPIDATASFKVLCVDEVNGVETELPRESYYLLDGVPARLCVPNVIAAATMLKVEYSGGYRSLPESVRQLILRTCLARFESRSVNAQPDIMPITDEEYLVVLI